MVLNLKSDVVPFNEILLGQFPRIEILGVVTDSPPKNIHLKGREQVLIRFSIGFIFPAFLNLSVRKVW